MTTHSDRFRLLRSFLWTALAVCSTGALALAQPAPSIDTPESGGALPDLEGDTVEVIVGVGSKALDPIAIPLPKCTDDGELCAQVAEVLRRDLELTGYFQVLPPKTYLTNTVADIDSPKYADWFNVGAKYLVTSEVIKAGSATNLRFRLHHVGEKREIPVNPRNFTGAMRSEVRYKTHEFVNALLEALTGAPGPFGTRITYSTKTGDWTRGVFVMDMDGHGVSGVASDGAINSLPSFSGGGIVYTSQGDMQDPVLKIGGKRLSKTVGKYRKAVMGPGGTYAVSVDTGDGSDIWLMSGGGELTRNLTQGQGDNVSPSWSKDGSKIAFVSNRSGSPQVYVMGADGGGQRRLTMMGAYNSTPDFGPDDTIVFAGLDGGTSDIFTVDLSGNVRRLTQDQGWNKDPTWSPDGRWVAFVSSRDGGRIFIMTADGRYQFPVSRKPCACATPDWGG